MTRKSQPRRLRGKNVTLDFFRQTIVDLIEEHGKLKHHEIVRLLGEDRTEGVLHDVSVILQKMKARGTVCKTEDGFFALGYNAKTVGTSRSDMYDQRILNYLKKNGGMARHAEIMYDLTQVSDVPHRFRKFKRRFKVRPSGESVEDTPSRIMNRESEPRTLRRHIRKLVDEGRLSRAYSFEGVTRSKQESLISLPEPERSMYAMPLWNYRMILNWFHPLSPTARDDNERRILLDRWVAQAGWAVKLTREARNLTPEYMLEDPKLRKAFIELMGRCPQDVANIKDGWRVEHEDDISVTQLVTFGDMVISQEELLKRFYILFEECEGSVGHGGSRLPHWHATGATWQAIADRLGVAVGPLSRGLPQPPEGRPGYDYDPDFEISDEDDALFQAQGFWENTSSHYRDENPEENPFPVGHYYNPER